MGDQVLIQECRLRACAAADVVIIYDVVAIFLFYFYFFTRVRQAFVKEQEFLRERGREARRKVDL